MSLEFDADPIEAPQPRKLALQGLTYLSLRLVGGLIQVILLAVLTRNLAPETYGLYSLFVVECTISILIFVNPLRHALIRFLPALDGEEARSVVGPLLMAATTVSLAALCFGGLSAISGAPHSIPVAHVSSVIATAIFVELGLDYHRRTLQPLRYGRLYLIRSLSQLALVGGAALTQKSATALMDAFVSAQVVALIFSPWRHWIGAVRRLRSNSANSARAAVSGLLRMLQYAVPLSLAELGGAALVQVDKLIIAARMGPSATGTYAAAMELTWQSLQLLVVSGMLASMPLVFERAHKGDDAGLRAAMGSSISLLVFLLVGPSLGLAVMAKPIAFFCLGPSFAEPAVMLIPCIVLTHFVYCIKTYWLDVSFMLAFRAWPILCISLAAAVSNLLLNYALVPSLGLLGAALATLLAAGLAMLATLCVESYAGLLHFDFPWTDFAKIAVSGLAMTGFLLAVGTPGSIAGLLATIVAAAAIYLGLCYMLRLSWLKIVELPMSPPRGGRE